MPAANPTKLTLEFALAGESASERSFKFAEIVPDGLLNTPKIGNVWIPKTTLAAMGWNGENFAITVTKK